MVRWHVAGFEMYFCDAMVIARDEAVENFGKETAFLAAEPAHDAEVDGNQPAGGIDKEISRMHVRVKEAIAQRVTQETLDNLARQVDEVDVARFHLAAIVQPDAVAPFQRQHA